jgi:hypothetical protein
MAGRREGSEEPTDDVLSSPVPRAPRRGATQGDLLVGIHHLYDGREP